MRVIIDSSVAWNLLFVFTESESHSLRSMAVLVGRAK